MTDIPDIHAPAFEASHKIQPAMSSELPGLPKGDTTTPYCSGVKKPFSFPIASAVISEGYTAVSCQQCTRNIGHTEIAPETVFWGRGPSAKLTPRRQNVEPKVVLRKRRRKLLGHMRHASLTRAIGKMRHRDPVEATDRARNHRLAALCHIALLVARLQQRQEGHDAKVHGAHIDGEGDVELVGLHAPQLRVQVGEAEVRLPQLRVAEGRPGDAGVGDEQVDVARLAGDVGDDALEVGFGGGVALDGDDVAVFLSPGDACLSMAQLGLLGRKAFSLARATGTGAGVPLLLWRPSRAPPSGDR